MDGCQEARNAITITEVPCPQCGVGVEVFIRDGSLAADAVCAACGHVIPAGFDTPTTNHQSRLSRDAEAGSGPAGRPGAGGTLGPDGYPF